MSFNHFANISAHYGRIMSTHCDAGGNTVVDIKVLLLFICFNLSRLLLDSMW